MPQEGSSPSAEELSAWLRLSHTDGIGPVRGRALLQCFGPPQAILEAGPGPVAEVLQANGLADALFRPDSQRDTAIAEALRWLEGGHAGDDWAGTGISRRILLLTDPAYPQRLLDLADPPLLLYCVGDPGWLSRPQVGIVGSRNATAIGARTAWDFGSALAAAGCTVVSGMAEGIDRAAHEGALAAPGGSTVAVLGTGIDRIYPSRHRSLAQRMAAQGALISEQPIGMPPLQANFPRRNRLIAALARGILVVEASLRSGSLITARLAAEIGREVLAVPGSIHSPLARGCNSLIRQGAKLVESADDILTEIPGVSGLGLRSVPGPGHMPPAPAADLAPDAEADESRIPVSAWSSAGSPADKVLLDEQARMLAAMSADPVMLETLAVRQGLPLAGALAALQTLELDGLVQRQLDGSYVRCPSSDSLGRSFGFCPKPVP
ncbi:MAG: DNA-protecting protein DprA [Lautropia sp.]|nr:DNA-protecting protein DprA [Lautropia sp.]